MSDYEPVWEPPVDEAAEREQDRIAWRDEFLSGASLEELIAVRGDFIGTRDEDAMEAQIAYRLANPTS